MRAALTVLIRAHEIQFKIEGVHQNSTRRCCAESVVCMIAQPTRYISIGESERVKTRRTAGGMSPVDIFVGLSIVQRRRFQEYSSTERVRSVRIVNGRRLASGENVRIGRDLIGVSMGYIAVVKEHLIHGAHTRKSSTFNVFTVHLVSSLSI